MDAGWRRLLEQCTEELRSSEARFRAVADCNADAIVIVDEEGRIRFSNAAAAELLGGEAAELAGKQFGFPIAGGEWSEVQVPRASGVRCAEMRVAPVVWDGHPAWLASLRDVTERRALQEQLRQAEKLEAVGLLAGGVAHDFNNLLTVIIGYAQILLQSCPPAAEPAQEILSAAERAAALVRQLLAFSRRQMLVPRIVDLNALCAGIQPVLARLAGEKVEIRSELAPGLGLVCADAAQLEQVILNLAINSLEAMPGGGVMTLRSANVEMENGEKTVDGICRPGSYVMLEVRDTGSGMNAAMMPRIFEPFFTTKEFGKGTGMGLSTVHGIVKQSGGEIAVESQPGQGTAFRVYLPRATDEVAIPLRPTAPARAARSTTVLVVDDEPALRSLLRTTLEQLGYAVLEADGGAAALGWAAGHPGPIDLVIIDVAMPGMNARDLAPRILRFRPGARILFMSGYPEAPGHNGPFLQKPFTREQLSAALRRLHELPA